MYLSNITGNILNKFNKQKINILYEPQRNLFDVILGHCGFTLFFDKQYNFFETIKNNMIQIDNGSMDLFNYNVGITNSIVSYSSNKFFSAQHLNTIICTHSYRPTRIKKEDLVLMSNNLAREKKIFFAQDVSDNWNTFSNRYTIKYGIPTDIFYQTKDYDERLDNVLILNFENSPNAESMASLLEGHEIKVNLIKDITGDANAIRELFNRYKVVVDFSEHNIINILSAISCGCNGITYMGDMILKNYSNVPNLFMAKSVQDLIETIRHSLKTKPVSALEYISDNFSFDTFKNSMSEIIISSNNEAFIL